MRFGQPMMSAFPPRPAPTSSPTAPDSYLDCAEACLVQAAAAPDATARALHEEECTLWLMLARQRRAIEDVVRTYVREVERA